jgi:hypothetical protein
VLANLVLLLALVAPKSGAAMCALGAADFKAVGVVGAAAKPTANVQDGGASTYCVYAGKSAATGGIELDVFYPAGANRDEVMVTYVNAMGEAGAAGKPIKLAGVDEARFAPAAVSGGPAYALLGVRRWNLVFMLGIPTSKDAQAQLTKLAELVLKRLGAESLPTYK